MMEKSGMSMFRNSLSGELHRRIGVSTGDDGDGFRVEIEPLLINLAIKGIQSLMNRCFGKRTEEEVARGFVGATRNSRQYKAYRHFIRTHLRNDRWGKYRKLRRTVLPDKIDYLLADAVVSMANRANDSQLATVATSLSADMSGKAPDNFHYFGAVHDDEEQAPGTMAFQADPLAIGPDVNPAEMAGIEGDVVDAEVTKLDEMAPPNIDDLEVK